MHYETSYLSDDEERKFGSNKDASVRSLLESVEDFTIAFHFFNGVAVLEQRERGQTDEVTLGSTPFLELWHGFLDLVPSQAFGGTAQAFLELLIMRGRLEVLCGKLFA